VKINRATISERAGHWFVSLQVEEIIETPMPATNDVIGIDVGIKYLAVLSNGKVFDNQKTLYKHEGRLSKLQRELSRRTKGSYNREKTRRKLAKAHYKVECVRKNNLHNITSYIIKKKKPSIIVIENLNIVGMMQNRHLSKALADASLSEIKRQIIYKAKWHGVKVVEADRWYPSSKTCSNCENRKPMLSLGERVYKCEACGHIEDRDLNAAKNLKNLVNKEPVNGGGLPVELACSNVLL
jgi:putative transposase